MTPGATTSLSLGQLGSTYITDTAEHTGDFGIIQALESTVIAALVSGVNANGDTVMSGTLAAMPLPAGMSIYGRFSSITLGSGKVIAYNN